MLRRLAGVVELWGRLWHPQVLVSSSQMADVLSAFREKRSRNSWKMSPRQRITTSIGAWGQMLQFPLAQTGEGIAECEILKWLVKEGDEVSRFQKVCEIQSDKASMEITSPYEGKIHHVHYSTGDIVKVGETILTIESNTAEGPSAGSGPSPARTSQAKHGGDKKSEFDKKVKGIMTPAVRHFVRESGVDIASIVGSGQDGRILREDVVAAMNPQALHDQHPAPNLETPTGEHVGDFLKEPIRTPIRGYRRAMVKSMDQAATIPHFHFCDEVSMGSLLLLKAQAGENSQSPGKLTVLPFIIKALSIALQTFPDLNASLSSDHSEILQFHHHNVGIAMATPDGLVVPNIKNVESQSIREIGEQLTHLKEKAVAGKLTHEDINGGTITVSNIGAIGGTYAAPLVNHPEVAIVALGKIRDIPVATGNQDPSPVVFKAFMPITWGADHRVADGAMLANFNNYWKKLVEQPEQMLLHLR